MKSIFNSVLILMATLSTLANASEIMLSKNIKPEHASLIRKDLTVLENSKFEMEPNPQILKVMNLESFSAQSIAEWLNKRVHYILSENDLKSIPIIQKNKVFIQRYSDFPNSNMSPYSLDTSVTKIDSASGNSLKIMSNIGSAIYQSGKLQNIVYGISIKKGLFGKAENIIITSPSVGVIQIGEGLFYPRFMINRNKPEAYSNSIFRLTTFFHEARHGDGNGISLGFMHAICPIGHDYQGLPACDENLNGPYKIEALMTAEMTKNCEDNCSLIEKEALKILILDKANRVLKTTHKAEPSKEWDPTIEEL
ncbi:MAG: hypothetical protein Q7U04_03475 [Bacteriovorax sp.]|nr:hypothetical protein [Bacteriovorax sp.]